jgi:hypothetical protein
VVVPANIVGDGELQSLEIQDHVVLVEALARDYDLDSASMPVRESASLRVLAQHVTRLDGERFADPVSGHIPSLSFSVGSPGYADGTVEIVQQLAAADNVTPDMRGVLVPIRSLQPSEVVS